MKPVAQRERDGDPHGHRSRVPMKIQSPTLFPGERFKVDIEPAESSWCAGESEGLPGHKLILSDSSEQS